MQRIEEYNQLLEDSKEVLRKDTTLWKGFLKFATQFTHYQFFDQILIYVQNPKATACATFDQWKKIGRYVRKGEHSIVLLDETGKRGKLRHIFDVTATGPDQEFEYRPKPILPEQREELARKLNAAYSRENSAYAADSARWDGDLEHTLSQIALSMTQEYYNLSPDQAAAQSESTEIPAYYIATATSAMYLLLEKYGFSQEAESLDFSCMNQLDMETFSGVGNAASAILSWTARLVRTVQREQVRERGNEHERNDNGRYSETDHISSGGMRKNYLKENNLQVYESLVANGTLFQEMVKVDEAADRIKEQVLPQLLKDAGVTEELKQKDQLKWVGLMESCHHQVEEIILTELVYS